MLKKLKLLKTILIMLLISFATSAMAEDLGFRYNNGQCVNSSGIEGLNPSFFGQCSDLRGTTLHKLSFDNVDLSGSQLVGTDLQNSSFRGARLEGVNFENSILSGVKFDDAIVLNTRFVKATLKNVTFSDAQIRLSDFSGVDFQSNDFSYIVFDSCQLKSTNFSKAVLTEAQFLNSDLTAAVFAEAELTKSSFRGSTLNSTNFSMAHLSSANLSELEGLSANFKGANLNNANLQKSDFAAAVFSSAKLIKTNLTGANLSKVNLKSADLTGAIYKDTTFADSVYSKRTLLPFSEEKAKEMGMKTSKSVSALILWDTMNDKVTQFAESLKSLSDGSIEITVSSSAEYLFAGQFPLDEYNAIIHFGGTSYDEQEMPQAGQQAILKFVRGGGSFIYGEWLSYGVSNGRYRTISDLILFKRDSGGQQSLSLTIKETERGNPLFDGLSNSFTLTNVGYNVGKEIVFAESPVKVLATDDNDSAAVAVRNVGEGRSIAFNFTCTYLGDGCLGLVDVQKLYVNAILYE